MARSSKRRPTAAKPAPASQLRIIGGEWRGRRVPFSPLPGLRPTPDRVRETLFNWLQPYIAGARCLDLFSGSGALGLEALSRGAESVTFVDQETSVVRHLRDNLQLLKSSRGEVAQASAPEWLAQVAPGAGPFDIVFMDPPFRKGMAEECCRLLTVAGVLAEDAIVYVETESDLGSPVNPPHWQLHRDKKAGQVQYRMFFAPPAADLNT